MSKKHKKSRPAPNFSGVLSATPPGLRKSTFLLYAFPEHTRPLSTPNQLSSKSFLSIVGHIIFKSPTFVLNQKDKGIWRGQSLI